MSAEATIDPGHPAGSAPVHVTITPPEKWGSFDPRELWAYRELLYFLTKRELQIRYKQSFFGVAWAVAQPVALALIFTVFFGRLAKVGSDGLPYPVFALSALVVWVFTSQCVAQSAGSLLGDSNLLSKVYFPRLAIPLAKVLSLLVDLTVGVTVVLLCLMLYGLGIPVTAPVIIPAIVLALLTGLGMGFFFAALNVKYRDVAVAVPLFVQLWLFATPVVYPGSLVSGAWQYVYALNPMVSVVETARWALLGSPGPSLAGLCISLAVAIILFLGGLTYFTRTERYFADII